MLPVYTLSDLQKETHAFDSFKKIEECDIPEYYKKVFPHKCQCGAEMIMTEPGHTQLQCCNPHCWVKMAHKFAYFVSYLGFKGFGENSALNMYQAAYEHLPFYSFLAIFEVDDATLYGGLSDHYIQLFRDIEEELKGGCYQLVDIISALGIPNIGPRSALFDVVKSATALLQYCLDGKTNDLCDMAGINAPMTRFWLENSVVDIMTVMHDVVGAVLDTPKSEIHIAITGKVSVDGTPYTRTDFIKKCESFRDANGGQLFKLIETKAADKLEYVIADEPSSSSKYNLGKRLNKLVTAQQFYDELRKLADAKNSKNEDSEEAQ